MQLHGFQSAGKRFVPDHAINYHRGIAIQKGCKKIRAQIFGSGTIKVNQTHHLNKGSCYKFVTDEGNRSRKGRKDFLKKSDGDIIKLVRGHLLIQTNGTLQDVNGVKLDAPLQKSAARTELDFVTYNVLFPQPKGDHANPFNTAAGYSQRKNGKVYPNDEWRLEIKGQNIVNANPNALALQEVTEDEFKYYKTLLWRHGYMGVFSGTHTKNVSHGVAIFYKIDQFQLLAAKKGTFAGQKRDNQGHLLNRSNGSPIMGSRKHLLLDLQDKTSGTIVRVVSCHLIDPRDWKGDEKSSHAATVVKHAKTKNPSYKVDVVVVAGDMNQDQFGNNPNVKPNANSRPADLKSITAFRPFMKKFKADTDHKPTEYDKDPTKDPKGYNGDMETTGRKIDWFFVKASKRVKIEEYQPVELKHTKTNNQKPLVKGEIDIRGSDHTLKMTKVTVARK